MTKLIIVNKWLAEAKARDLKAESRGYNAEFSDLASIDGEPDQMGFIGEIAKETEKAICLSTEVADCTGGVRNWNVWFPKSQIIKIGEIEIK